MRRTSGGALLSNERPNRFAVAPASHTHLERAVYRLATYQDASVWQEELADTALYERLGLSLHSEDLEKAIAGLWGTHEMRPRYQLRYDSFLSAEIALRKWLREGLLRAVIQRRIDGRIFPFAPDWWAQRQAPLWFLDGSCFVVDPSFVGSNRDIVGAFGVDLPEDRGFEADLFVNSADLSKQTSAHIDAPLAPTEEEPSGESGRRRGRPKTKVPQIEQALREEYPDGPPAFVDRKAMAKKIGERLGGPVSPQSLDRARKTAWE